MGVMLGFRERVEMGETGRKDCNKGFVLPPGERAKEERGRVIINLSTYRFDLSRWIGGRRLVLVD